MQRGFTKLFNTIVTSTIWQEDNPTRIVWITMLAICDADGQVSSSIPGLASVSNVSVQECVNAITKLESPDIYSRTKDFDGRRIEPVEGGWVVLNYVKYRRMMNAEERKEYKRVKQAQYRERERIRRGQSVDKCRTSVETGGTERTVLTQAEAEEEAEANLLSLEKKEAKKAKPVSEDEVIRFCKNIGLPESDGTYFWYKWEANGFCNAGKRMKNWEAVIRSWKSAGHCPSQKNGNGKYLSKQTTPYQAERELKLEREMQEARRKNDERRKGCENQ